MGNKFVVVDLETTGNSPRKGDRIIQIGAVIIEDGKIIGKYSSLVNPGKPIPAFIEELTGINDEMVSSAPAFSEIAGEIMELLDEAFFVAHNVLFDLGFLQDELQMAGYEGFYGSVLDTVELARILFPTADSYKLSDLAAREGLSHDRPHQADSDAYVTGELLLLFLDKLESFPTVTIKSLTKLSAGLKSDIYLLLEEILQQKEQVVEEYFRSIEVYRGIALRKKEVSETPEKQQVFLFPEEKEEQQKLLKKAIPSFEVRDGQLEMMNSIYHAFSDQRHALIEAGTGIGKTLAYLVPAVFYAKETQKRVVVSTYTTQLQQQLLIKDFPILRDVCGFPIKAILLKGRSHYINLARFEHTLREEDDNYDTTLTKMQILVWLLETNTGDFDELNLSSGGMLYWNKIKNVPVTFLQTKQWDSRDYYLRAQKEAEEADLIITNHSMLLMDLVSEETSIPSYEFAILDEAHQFEKVAGKYYGRALDYLSIRLMLNQFGQFDHGQFFHRLEKLIEKLDGRANIKVPTKKLNEAMINLQYETDELFKTVTIFAKRKKRQSSNNNKLQTMLTQTDNSTEWKALFAVAERFSFLLKDVINAIEDRLMFIENQKHRLTEVEKSFLEEISLLLKEMNKVRNKTREVFLFPSGQEIRWIETDLRSVQNMTTVYGRPVHVANHLRNDFFAKKKSIILTSATLTVNGSFQYIKNELGISEFSIIESQIQSPFHYKEQVQLIIPEDLPDIKTVPETEYIAAITEHIISIAEATGGRMLTLFTSHEMLKKTYELIKESGLLDDFALIAQGITAGSRSRLTRNFQRFEKAILFGTSSFWEGIDIPGEDLSCIVIVRLPFSPPDEPLAVAKRDLILQQGGNPFNELSLPEAVLRFKQGFGRLVRSSTDRGIIFVFDRRIITTSYGKAFLQSIPTVPIQRATIDEMINFINKWL
ncbi:ATP-dependent DNA helicase DinG [Mesobacillus maritimus]|uniref:3'-5' exonuclease DinG n=1 Tax=Mesobacillus maritimus TaxID=1643336 RepID=A0ABS7K373_9BACI|nr:ATP-dependent DNA helicase DinG [Mesobacillus maritimus]MBY0096575.1 ATP-dependent DNA helicase DinG [Mesobacillus maritimus]